eukprot:403350869
MLKSNQKGLVYFTIKETIHCFLKKGQNGNFIEESDISNFVLNEMFRNNLAETLTVMDSNNLPSNDTSSSNNTPKTALDYNVLYTLLDVLDTIGLIQRKADSQCNQRFLTWLGFKRFRDKFRHLFTIVQFIKEKAAENVNQDIRTSLEKNEKFQAMNFLEKFMQELFIILLSRKTQHINGLELQDLKNFYVVSNDLSNVKEQESRKRIYQVFKYTLIYLGLVEKTLDENPNIKHGLRWALTPNYTEQLFLGEESPIYKYQVELQEQQKQQELQQVAQAVSESKDEEMKSEEIKVEEVKEQEPIKNALIETAKLDELKFLEQRRQNFIIEFKKEPPKSSTQCFENSGFAMFKGKQWRYFMQKLYCIIGRSPINYKKKNIDLKVVWHVDVDLGHLRKVSRQHALIIYNSEKEHFEIKCLSKKYPVYVNGEAYYFKDEPQPLHSRSIELPSWQVKFLLKRKNAIAQLSLRKILSRQFQDVLNLDLAQEVKYMGGDPRFIFTTIQEERCVQLNENTNESELVFIQTMEEQTQEFKINEFNADQINSYLNENGFFKEGESSAGQNSKPQQVQSTDYDSVNQEL